MNVSMICTVLNEQKNLKDFLDSVVEQTQIPDELIIVDGGSKDRTYEILRDYSKKYRWIKIHQVKGLNISEGRNYAINHSKGNIIFTSDCGTIFEKNWIKKIVKGFDEGADIVFGKWKVSPSNTIEKFLVSRSPSWNKIDLKTIIPSNRQTAFKKDVWKKVGGFPNHLKRADDNWFHLKAHSLKMKYLFIKNAVVLWRLDRNFFGMIKLAFLDSKTEGFSLIFTERRIYVAEIILFFLGVLALIGGLLINIKLFLYPLAVAVIGALILGGMIPHKKVRDIRVLFLGPIFFIMLYLAHVLGVLFGIIQRAYRKKE